MNLKEVLESALSLYDKQIESRQITVITQYRLNGAIQSYAGEIRRIFSTLLVNAMEAVPQGGRITLRARNSADWRNPGAPRGVRITLSDTGSGIPEHLVAHIFEPFFTTKASRASDWVCGQATAS